ncbi:MAG TPA: hypothetical protein VFT29_14660 [Gemmatimonadaceae bacterium]|nr:hypothetical protein [Gemmatimonadaceae bacterium]
MASTIPAAVSAQIRVIRLSPLGVPISPIGVAVAVGPVGLPALSVRDTAVVPSTERPVDVPHGPALLPIVVPNQPVVPRAEQPYVVPYGPRLIVMQPPSFQTVARSGVTPQNYAGPALQPITPAPDRLTPIFVPYP